MHPDRDFDPPAARRMRLFLVFLGIAGAILLFLVLMRKPHAPVGLWHPGVGDRLKELSLDPLLNTDQTVRLSDLEDNVTLINFWGPWCGPCLMEMPELLQLEQEYRGRNDVQFLLVSYAHSRDEDDRVEDLRSDSLEAIGQLESEAPIYRDAGRQLLQDARRAIKADRFVFPTTLILDRRGKIRAIWTSYDPGAVGEMRQAVEKLLAESGT